MRATLLFLALAAGAGAAPDPDDRTIEDEKHNFRLSLHEDLIDWDKEDVSELGGSILARFKTIFADTEPEAYSDFQLIVVPLSSFDARRSLDKIADSYKASYEALDNPRNRKTSFGKLGKGENQVDCYTVTVQGDRDAGLHEITWTLAKNGAFLYILYSLSSYKAVGDEQVEEELKMIRDSFTFLRIERVKKHKDGRKKGVGGPAGGKGAAAGPQIDPELLAEKKYEEDFWRFECTKPEGLVAVDRKKFLKGEKDYNMVLKFEGRHEQSYCLIRVYAQTERAKKFTLQQLLEIKVKGLLEQYKGKQHKEPEIDTKYKKKFPGGMARKAVRLELVGRRYTTERTWYMVADCKNGRQYGLEIFVTGTAGPKTWKKQIDEFLKSFKTKKK